MTNRKPGKTLLVSMLDATKETEQQFQKYPGVLSCTRATNSFFVVFDTIDNSVSAYNDIKTTFTDATVKYSHYRVFMTISNLTPETNYTDVKEQFVKFLEETTKTNVLFFKLYKKDNNYLGCGDFTLDSLEGMNILLNRENGLKEYKLGEFTGNFYRYNSKKSGDGNVKLY